MDPKKCDYSKTVVAGFLAIAVFSFYCGSWLLGLTLVFITALHVVDVRSKNRRFKEFLDNKARIAQALASRRK